MTDEPTEVSVPPASCYRHADRETYIVCQRCERPICPDCMHQASVGFQCPDCVRDGHRSIRTARTPYGGRRTGNPGAVTMVLLGINLVVFLLILLTGGRGSWLVDRLALLPESAFTLDDRGFPVLVRGVADGAWWQLVTSMFSHTEIWHIGFNMLALYVLGPQLEAMLGRWRFVALYLLSGLTGSAFVYWLSPPNSQTLGASGALFGLMAALLIVAVKVRGDVQSLLVLVGINLLITVVGRGFISWQGHLGGFLGGLVLAVILVYAPRAHRTAWQVAGVGVYAVALLAALVARTAIIG